MSVRKKLLLFVVGVALSSSVASYGGPADVAAPKQAGHDDRPFVHPPSLDPDVRFWERVYTQVGTDGGLIHDDEHLDVVYQQLTFPDDVSSHARAKIVDNAKKKYASILRKLAGGASNLSTDEQRVRDLWPSSASRATFLHAAHHIRFQLGQADRFKQGLIRSGRWMPAIQKIFEAQGLPKELAALPHVESSFNPYAYSKVGAAGMWQFMRGTGRRFLRIDSAVDERLDPYKSSRAAASFLEQNYAILGNWPLALTAYNHGPAGMRRAVEKLGTEDIAVILRDYDSRTFGFASRNFYLAFLAALDIDSNPQKFFGPIHRDSVDVSHMVVLPDFMPMPSIVKAAGVSEDDLKRLNPSLLPSVWSGARRVPRGFELRAPPTIDLTQALAHVDDSHRFDKQVRDTKHRVQRGETLSLIAAHYGVSQRRLADANNLRPPYFLRVGQSLDLPTSVATAATTVASTASTPIILAPTDRSAASSSAAKPEADSGYVVRRGDTLSRIAAKLGISEDRLMSINNIKDADAIYEGQVLTKSEQEASSEPAAPTVAPSAETVAEVEPPKPDTDSAEPTSDAEAEDLGPTLVPGAQTADNADPSDYTVREDGTIRVEATETLGHYADWLDIRTSHLRSLNHMSYRTPLVLGHRVRLDFSRVSRAAFEAKRTAYHRQLQDDFFAQYRITGSESHKVHSGDSLWILSQKRYNVPIWLLRQYNPDLDLESLRPGVTVVIPTVEAIPADTSSP